MANVVEIVVTGRDTSGPALTSAVNNTRTLGRETKSLGGIVTATGNVMANFGNNTLSRTAQTMTMMTFATREAMRAFTFMQASLKRTVAGLAVVAVALGAAYIVERIQAAKEAQKQLNEDTETYNRLLDQMLIAEQRLTSEEGARWREEQFRHSERVKQINELTISDEQKNSARLRSQDLMNATVAKMVTDTEQQEARITRARQEANKKQFHSFSNYTMQTAGLLGQLASMQDIETKKGFKRAQALRYGEAVMATASGIARAFADYPWPYALVPAAFVAAAGAIQIATIAGASYRGQAHSGMDYVPREGSYNVQQGEMILDPGTSQEVRDAATGRAGGGWGSVLMIDGRRIGDVLYEMSRDGRLRISERAIVA